MFVDLWHNLTKIQKIVIVSIFEIVFILTVVVIVNLLIQTPKATDVTNIDTVTHDVPNQQTEIFQEQLYSFLRSKFNLTDKTQINDVVIRENTYKKENNIATFLIDIDSLRATYSVKIRWNSDGKGSDSVIINCPPKDQMKYQETFCEGMYNNTSSPELYLPHTEYSSEKQDRSTYKWSIYIPKNNSKQFLIDLKTCDNQSLYDQRYAEAMAWLKSTPIQLDKYDLIIETSCEG